jgi:hypothetical protein
MRSLLVALIALAVTAAPAAAKEVSKVVVCGSGGQCTTLDRKHDGNLMAFVEGGAPVDAPTTHAPFYRVRITMAEGPSQSFRFTNLWVPALHRLGTRDGGWQWISTLPEGLAALRQATRGLQPLPASELPGVVRAPRPAPDPGAPAWPWYLGAAVLAALLAAAAFSARSRPTRRSGRRAPRPSDRPAA